MEVENIEIRTAKVSDIDDILQIENTSFAENICENRDVFIERIKIFNKGFLIAQYKNEIIGYICTEIWNYNEIIKVESFTLGHSIKDSHNSNGDELYISSFAIAPKARHCGIGRMLFKYVINNINNLIINPKSILLVVAENWSFARKIYTNEGFKEICKINDFFHYDKEEFFKADGIVMRKLL